MSNAPQPPHNHFEERLRGKFSGILRWADLDTLWERILAEPEGWYLYETREDPPEHIVDSAGLRDIIHSIDRVLREKHKHDYCGIVYADDPAEPGMVKIYDPENLGVVCGPGGERILPRWILSRERPERLRSGHATQNTGNSVLWGNNTWWRRIFS
ncbi:MAG: hypothetical protein KJO08_04695 [Gammaproteobacteria bacterium]|nr:hypothetical protein [Gammaproteobacteria bacterium]NNJ84788.1 hypothetical protein [Gammaproteobacteria bacterium]